MPDRAARGAATKVSVDPLSETAQKLQEVRRILAEVEAAALSGVAMVLVEAAESLSRTAKHLADTRPAEWMTAEQSAAYLGCSSVGAFEKIAAREGIPRHYLSGRKPLYNRAEIDAWLMERREPPCA